MKQVAMIFNGVHFYQSVADRAFARAKKSHAKVLAVFLKAARETPEGYGFPSDLGAAEEIASSTDAERDDEKIIDDTIRLVEDQAAIEHVELQTLVLEEPTEESFRDALGKAGMIFLQGHDEKGNETPAGVNLKKLLGAVSIPVEIVQ